MGVPVGAEMSTPLCGLRGCPLKTLRTPNAETTRLETGRSNFPRHIGSGDARFEHRGDGFTLALDAGQRAPGRIDETRRDTKLARRKGLGADIERPLFPCRHPSTEPGFDDQRSVARLGTEVDADEGQAAGERLAVVKAGDRSVRRRSTRTSSAGAASTTSTRTTSPGSMLRALIASVMGLAPSTMPAVAQFANTDTMTASSGLVRPCCISPFTFRRRDETAAARHRLWRGGSARLYACVETLPSLHTPRGRRQTGSRARNARPWIDRGHRGRKRRRPGVTRRKDSSMSNGFGSRPVLVTGCSSGIGMAVASRLLRRGAIVYATARRRTR